MPVYNLQHLIESHLNCACYFVRDKLTQTYYSTYSTSVDILSRKQGTVKHNNGLIVLYAGSKYLYWFTTFYQAVLNSLFRL